MAIFAITISTAHWLVKYANLSPIVQSTEKNRYSAIDGIRGLLAMGVFIHHCVITWFFIHGKPWQAPPSIFYVEIGQVAVALFFMITAFLFFGRILDQKNNFEWGRFFVSRLFRIYPLYLMVISIVALVVMTASGFHLNESIWTITKEILKWAFDFSSLDINALAQTFLITAGVQWTLLHEFQFYAIILPVIWLFMFNLSRKITAINVAILALLLVAIINPLQLFHFDFNVELGFIGGIIAALYVRKFPKNIHTSPLASLVALLAISVVLFTQQSAYDISPMLLLTTFFTIIATGNSLFGLLSKTSLLWLGEISYSIYMLHGIIVYFVLNKFFYLFMGAPTQTLPVSDQFAYVLTSLACAVAIVIVASITYYFVELPGIGLGKKLLSKKTASV